MMRPKRRAIMPSSVDLIISIGASMLASIAFSQTSRVNCRKSPLGGPPALFTRMSGAGHAARSRARPSGVATSATTGVTVAELTLRISLAVRSSASAVRPLMTTLTPSLARATAQPMPRPALEAQTIADLPAISSSRWF